MMTKAQIKRTVKIIELLEHFVKDDYYEIISEARLVQQMLKNEEKKLPDNS